MYKIIKGLIAVGVVLMIASNAWALPVATDSIIMGVINSPSNEYHVPYTVYDIRENKTYTSFCLESSNYFTNGGTYYVDSVGPVADGGGLPTVRSPHDTIDGITGDPISDFTKWLYAAFMSDVLNGYSALEVQQAIWWEEGETLGNEGAWNTLSTFRDNSLFDATGWNIVAVNISSRYNDDNQSQLIGVAPVPEPGTMLLFGVGLVGMAGLGRRRFLK